MTQARVSTATYEPELANIAAARAWVAEQVGENQPHRGRLVADAELVVSELMTNAIKAGTTRLSIEVQVHPERVLISVEDDADGELAIRPRSATAVGGRGLPIVAALSTRWGVETSLAGKRVWASIPIRSAEQADG